MKFEQVQIVVGAVKTNYWWLLLIATVPPLIIWYLNREKK